MQVYVPSFRVLFETYLIPTVTPIPYRRMPMHLVARSVATQRAIDDHHCTLLLCAVARPHTSSRNVAVPCRTSLRDVSVHLHVLSHTHRIRPRTLLRTPPAPPHAVPCPSIAYLSSRSGQPANDKHLRQSGARESARPYDSRTSFQCAQRLPARCTFLNLCDVRL